MSNTKGMKVKDGSGYLMRDLSGSLLSDFEVLALEVGEEVSSLEVLHDDVYVVRILKDIVESDDVGMLAHFQYFYLSFKQLKILEG